MTDRIPLDDLNSDQLDALYARAETAEAERDRLSFTNDVYLEKIRRDALRLHRLRNLAERWKYTGDRKGGPRTELLTALTGEPHHPPAP